MHKRSTITYKCTYQVPKDSPLLVEHTKEVGTSSWESSPSTLPLGKLNLAVLLAMTEHHQSFWDK